MELKHTLVLYALLPLAWSCAEVKDWSDPKDSVPPGPVSNVVVENRHGGAKLTFDIPEDQDLLGVKAVYKLKSDGETYEAFSSSYADSIVIEGFPDTEKRTVEIFAIDKSMNPSPPVSVEVEPLVPPIQLVRESMYFGSDFGGVTGTWSNKYKADLAMEIYREEEGKWVLLGSHYSQKESDIVTFRGLEATQSKFKVVARDRWMNYAEPLEFSATPLFEQYLYGKDPVTGVELYKRYGNGGSGLYRGDIDRSNGNSQGRWSQVLDGNKTSGNWFNCGDLGNKADQYLNAAGLQPEVLGADVTMQTDLFPVYMTIDIGKPAILSRLVWFNRIDNNNPFRMPWPTHFEMWGSLEPPTEPSQIGDGGYLDNWKYWTAWSLSGFQGEDTWKKDWTYLGDCKLELESGARLNGDAFGPGEVAFLNAGVSYNVVPEGRKPVQYIRLVFFNAFSDQQSKFQIREIEFHGSYLDEEAE